MEIKQKEITLKNNEKALLSITNDNNDDFFIITATNNYNEKIGYASFKITKKTCFLFKIEITSTNYSHMGLGSKMLEYMEEFALGKFCNFIDGKFFPFGELGQYAKDFYTKHGYIISKEGYETFVSKYIDHCKTTTL